MSFVEHLSVKREGSMEKFRRCYRSFPLFFFFAFVENRHVLERTFRFRAGRRKYEISFDIVGQNGFFAKIVSFSRGVDVTRATPFRFVKKVRRNFGGIPSSLFRSFRVSLLRGVSTIVEHDFRIQRGFYIYIYFFATIAKASPSRAIRSARLDSDRRGFLEKNAKVPGFIRGINRSRKRCVRRSETEKVRAR